MKKIRALFYLQLALVAVLSLVCRFEHPTGVHAQSGGYVTVVATIPSYAGGQVTGSFVNQSSLPQLPLLNGSVFATTAIGNLDFGGFFSFAIADNTIIQPNPSQWHFVLCWKTGNPSQPCFPITIPITCVNNPSCVNGTLDISAAFAGAPLPGSNPLVISPEQIGTDYYADGFPSSCNVGGTPYTTQLDCAWRTALAATAIGTYNPTLILGSKPYTTCAGLPEILPGAMGSASVHLATLGGPSGHNAGNFSVSNLATVTQTCAISTGTLSLPEVSGSAFKLLSVLGVSFDANHLAPYAIQILGQNESSVFRDIQVANGTTGPAVLGVAFDFTNGFTVNATIDNWQIVDNCSTGLCGGGGAVTVSLSGGVPSFTVTNPGSQYDSDTIATLVGYQNGTRNNPCNTVGVTTPVISGGLLTGINSTASGCSGTVYVHLSDQRKSTYGLDLENVTDSRINGLDIRTGAIAGLFCQSCGSDVFTGVHAWGQGLFGIQTRSFATFVGTDCGEVSLACFDNSSTFAKTIAVGTMYNSGTQYQGYSLFRNETSTGEFQISGVICQTTQTAEYHTLANAFGVIDTNAQATSVNTLGNSLKDVEYCGSGTGETLNVTPGNATILGNLMSPGTTSLGPTLNFSLNATPFVDCTATGFTQPPTISGSVLTFPSNGTDNSGSVLCTDFAGRTTVQSIPNSGTPTVSQTFDLTTQFAVSGQTWIQLAPPGAGGKILLNAPSGVAVQGGNLSVPSGTGVTGISSNCSANCTAQLPNLSTAVYTVAASIAGTTGSIGGAALTAGQSTSGTAFVSGALTTMGCFAQPTDGTNMAATGFAVGCTITSAGTATVSVTAIVAGTPAAKTYAVRVIE